MTDACVDIFLVSETEDHGQGSHVLLIFLLEVVFSSF